jgi:hypothetical protein
MFLTYVIASDKETVVQEILRKKWWKLRQNKRNTGSDDTASMVKGGGYIGALTRQPPTAQTNKKIVWVRGVVCRSTQTHTMTVVA